jgi:pilus assembly protein Flp/PilA
MDTHSTKLRNFASDEEGAQILEYALIIAVISLTVLIALRDVTGGGFSNFIVRLSSCVATPSCV